ncbi:hypothetical protein ScPMuIL_014090 [Solemya velum]
MARHVPFQHPFVSRSRVSSWEDPWYGETAMVPAFQQHPRFSNQQFGQGFHDDEMMSPAVWRGYYPQTRGQGQLSQLAGKSEISIDGKEFKVSLDVNQFSPGEISVKTVDNCITVHAKHEEKQDEHGTVKREFTRQYTLPQTVDPMTVTSSLAADGVLTLKAPIKLISRETLHGNSNLCAKLEKESSGKIRRQNTLNSDSCQFSNGSV